MDRNNTNYPAELHEKLKALPPAEAGTLSVLKYHQQVAFTVFTDKRFSMRTRGLLIYHLMGMGKTMLAIAICLHLKKYYQIILILTRAMRETVRADTKKYLRLLAEAGEPLTDFDIKGEPNDEAVNALVDEHFSFITLTASNMMEQLGAAVMRKQLDKKLAKIVELDNLNNKLVIVDEAHNLFRMIINNPNGNGRKFYELVMRSQNLRLLFLSGTPIAKDPFEIVPCFNMLVGYLDGLSRPVSYASGKVFTVLPDIYEDFYRFFISSSLGPETGSSATLKNRAKLQNRLFGLVSYAFSPDVAKEFPEELPLIVKRIPMTDQQSFKYNMIRQKEREEDTRAASRPQQVPALAKPKGAKSSSYRQKSRQVSNAPGFDVTPDNITTQEWESNTVYHSPKIKAVVAEIRERVIAHQTGIVYSEFIGWGGMKSLMMELRCNGFIEFGEAPCDNLPEDSPFKRCPVFAAFTGSVDEEAREKIIAAYNSSENLNGGVIDVLLISKAGAEGLDLKNGRFAMALEPHWTMGRLKQFFARIIRFRSHIARPEDERTVQPYVFLTVHSETASDEMMAEKTTDEHIYDEAVYIQGAIDNIYTALKEVSIDCLIGGNTDIECRVCRPTNKKLFIADLEKDLQMNDPCETYEKEEVTAEKIIVRDKYGNETEYFYNKNAAMLRGYSIYKYSQLLDSYEELPVDDEYDEVVNAIENLR